MKRLLIVLVLHIGGCASFDQEFQSLNNDFLGERYDSALKKLEGSSIKDSSNNQLLYHLEKASILEKMQKLSDSRNELFVADRIADELYTTSIMRTAATFLVNEGSQNYEGEDYEKVAIHTKLALSFIQDRKLSEARVEAQKIQNKLTELTKDYDSSMNSYHEDAFSRYLTGIIYEAQGNIDDAIIDYQSSLSIYEQRGYRPFYQGSPPEKLVDALYLLAKKRRRENITKHLEEAYPQLVSGMKSGESMTGELVVVHEVGIIAPKRAMDFVWPIGKQLVRFSYPVSSRDRYYSFGQIGLEIPNIGFISADNAVDFNSIAKYCLEEKRGRMLLKGAARLLAKGQLTEQAYKSFGPLGGILANAYSVVTETADTRSWSLLPGAIYISRKRLPPGNYNVTTRSEGKFSSSKVEIKTGEMVLLRASL